MKFTFFLASLLFFGLFLISPSTAHADEASGNFEQDVNGYRVRLQFSSPARMGENTFHLFLQDLDNSPLSSPSVNLMVAPAAPGDENPTSPEKNPELAGHFILHSSQELPTPAAAGSFDWFGNQPADPNSESRIEHPADHIVLAMQPGPSAGEYTGNVTFPQAGRWLLIIGFTARGKAQLAQFSLQVADRPGIPMIGLAGMFAGCIVLVSGATLLRRKSMHR